MKCNCKCKRFSPVALGISLGILSGVVMMLCAWAAMQWNYAMPMVSQWSAVFPGFEATLKGGFFGLAWGFLEGFIFGVVVSWLYNLCLCCCASSCCCKASDSSCR
ncbi:MAG TPA: bacteriophage holin [Gammaproteobacteria bacterium]|nr:bacteriophage holin [Gammaproteobacteria bacterium]